jgi:hypothetical protein
VDEMNNKTSGSRAFLVFIVFCGPFHELKEYPYGAY